MATGGPGSAMRVTFATIGLALEIKEFAHEGLEVKEIDDSHFGQAGGWNIWIPGLMREPGFLNLRVRHDHGIDPAVYLGVADGLNVDRGVTTGDDRWEFTGGFLSQYQYEGDDESGVDATVRIKLNGAPNVTTIP